ncbi:hypothetical protein SteCoe_510 [Stentor coeruleus]|uniref:Uncharacterized protein n=1 Tax=Stentor coeruleus TaxID=5963 RepID=A0A1R2D416_9CILI|nr:hypothetical protein SteCoe_510 [Stentor coeruleus]
MICQMCNSFFDEKTFCCIYCFNIQIIPSCPNCQTLIKNILLNKIEVCPNIHMCLEPLAEITLDDINTFIFNKDVKNSQSDDNFIYESGFTTTVISKNFNEVSLSLSDFEFTIGREIIIPFNYYTENDDYNELFETKDSENMSDYDFEDLINTSVSQTKTIE